MKNTIPYPVKHWLTTLAIGPLILIIGDSISSFGFVFSTSGVYFLYAIFGLVFSLPVFGVYFWIYKKLAKTSLSSIAIKIILTSLGGIGIAVSFALINGSMVVEEVVSYSIALLIASTFYRIRPNEITNPST